MKAIILAAGYATRLYPITKDKPKPLLTIRKKPIIEYIISKLESIEQIDQIFIVTNQKFFNQFQCWLDNFPCLKPIQLLNDGSTNEKDKLGAIRDLALVLAKENINDDILVIGGDNLFSSALNAFIDFADAIRPDNAVGVYNLNGKYESGKYGVVELGEDKKIIGFYEKPSNGNGINHTGSTLISMCLYFFSKEKISLLQEYLKEGNDMDKAGSYIQWLSARDTVYGYTFPGAWLDIGDIDSYTEAVFTF